MPDIFELGLISFIVGFTLVKKFSKRKDIPRCITGGLGLMLVCEVIHMALITFI